MDVLSTIQTGVELGVIVIVATITVLLALIVFGASIAILNGFVPPEGDGELCCKCKKPIDARKDDYFYHCGWHHAGDCPE